MLTISSPQPLVFVIDTSAIFNRLQYAAEEIQLVTTPMLEKEMYKKGLKETVELLIATQKLRIIEPSLESLNKIKEAANQLGDLPYLSEPDQQLLALALDLTLNEFQVVIITDDYSVQNVAKRLSLEYKTTSQLGIREVIKWETYCPGCYFKNSRLKKAEPCPICGTALKRRAIRKQPL